MLFITDKNENNVDLHENLHKINNTLGFHHLFFTKSTVGYKL